MNNSGGGHVGHHSHGTHYVISEDIDILIPRWCKKVGLLPPPDDFYPELRSGMKNFLQDIFARVTFLDSQKIRRGLLESISLHRQAGLTIVCLERAYLEDSDVDSRIELTRTVDEDGDDIVIHSVRNGTPEKRVQFERARGKDIALIDDVIFSGNTLIETINTLHHHHTNVHEITVAVGVKGGIDNLNGRRFAVTGAKPLVVNCIEEFDSVSDQVCERDFYPGVPYSGREYFCENASFPYVLPFGNPGKWASIPEKEIRQFSTLCINNTIALFEEIERVNNRTITCAMVPRPVFGFPTDETRFVDALRKAISKI